MRKVVAMLVAEQPVVIWNQIALFHEAATPVERHRMKLMIGPTRDIFEQSASTEAGPLFGVPDDLVLAWADRGGDQCTLLTDFYPTLVSEGGKFVWHPAFADIAVRYAGAEAFRKSMKARIRPLAWSGSLIPLLERYLAPLESWFDHTSKELRSWAKAMHKSMEDQIEAERERESAMAG
jgi:hypothetical protein